MLQHKFVQFEHCLFQFSVFTSNILILIHIQYQFSIKKIKVARYARVRVILE